MTIAQYVGICKFLLGPFSDQQSPIAQLMAQYEGIFNWKIVFALYCACKY